MNKLNDFIKAIMYYEGWKPGSKSWRNNNPGNLRKSTGEFFVFDTVMAGLQTLYDDARLKCLGKTRTGLGPNSTIVDFFKVYAPSKDNNYPEAYASFVSLQCGLNPNSKLSEVYSDAP